MRTESKPHAQAGSISTVEYEFIRRLVYDHSRINLGHDKLELVRCRVQKRLRALNLQSFEAYCQLLDSADGQEELTALLDVISTNVTQFFREMDHFQFLEATVLPQFTVQAKRRGRDLLRVWSAACSSGQEPYSLAILLSQFFKHSLDIQWRIAATDISTRMLEAGRHGIYREEQVRLPEDAWLRAHFQKGTGSWGGHYQIKPRLRNMVEFRHLNLFDWPYPWSEKFHIVFCRNVMIYFDRPTQEQLVSRLAAHIEPGGFLFVGHSESLIGIEHGLKSLRPSVYQLPARTNKA